ncbi:unnamed protein product [Leuciscus chuanchicus]
MTRTGHHCLYPHFAHSVGLLWAHNWPQWGPTLLSVGQPTVSPHFGLSRWGPTWGPHVPRISRWYLGPQWAAHSGPTQVPKGFAVGPQLAPMVSVG